MRLLQEFFWADAYPIRKDPLEMEGYALFTSSRSGCDLKFSFRNPMAFSIRW